MQECRVTEHLDRELGPADRQHVQADLPTVRIDPADVRELYVAEAARRRILPRIQRIARHAIPVRELETRAVTENAKLAPDLPLRRLFGFQVGVTEVAGCKTRSQVARER